MGAGMIAHDQILPALLQMRREGAIGEVTVCSQRNRSVVALAEAPAIREAFPDVCFRAALDPGAPADEPRPEHYRSLLAEMPERSVVVVAIPDQLHCQVVLDALRANQHVCCVKPLVLRFADSIAIEREARSRGLLVGVEYHKRFDPRSIMARDHYRSGKFGEFRLGAARLMEKWHYRDSNFQNWFVADATDSFVYIGCHYVDLVHFVTGLLPKAVSVHGILDDLPNGNRGYLWTDARVLWDNGACLNVQNSLSFPDAAPGPNTQGMTLYCTGGGRGALLEHSDQYRGIAYTFGEPGGEAGGTQHVEPSPDYFLYQSLGGPGLVPTGYGVRSVRHIVEEALRIEREGGSADQCRDIIARIESEAILATPSNSRYNEALCEAARASIMDDGRLVELSA
ncbi:MAG: Gfo/Idh/MocA family oxidoreductase [Bryobacterales bacterium]|nr:Gfo/Idh/MocA family oxidoreductase [Bryobacterales bacterium]